jgi:hypothetical protein
MNKRKRAKLPPFVALSRATLKSKEWQEDLTAAEKVLYIHIKYKFVGDNNGEICLHYSELKRIMAPATASKAFKGLEKKEWIGKTKFGGMFRYVNHYKLTGKYDDALVNYRL